MSDRFTFDHGVAPDALEALLAGKPREKRCELIGGRVVGTEGGARGVHQP